MRGATKDALERGGTTDISIHTPHAGSDFCKSGFGIFLGTFQSTLPMRGATKNGDHKICYKWRFQSTLPMRGATAYLSITGHISGISIHTPHAGSDYVYGGNWEATSDFNPHSPCGERRFTQRKAVRKSSFQSTLPMRGATANSLAMFFSPDISIHTPHAGSDAHYLPYSSSIFYFNPHSPCGERQKLSLDIE